MPTMIDQQFLRKLYVAEDFEEILHLLKDQIREEFPQWSDLLDTNFGVALLELFSGIMDTFRYYQNVTAVESFPTLARQRPSLFRHAQWLSYIPKPAGAARAELKFTASTPAGATVSKGTAVTTADGEVTFRTMEDLEILPGEATGIVTAIHGTLVEDETLGTSDGSKNQAYSLSKSPLVVLPAASGEALPEVRVWVDGEEWEQVRGLAWAAAEGGGVGTAFRVLIGPDDSAWILFGDGTFGDIPPEGEEITASYVTGGGPEGNTGPNTITRIVGSIGNIARVTNPEAATGGRVRESEEELRKNIPSQVVTRGRAVTRRDYRTLLEAFAEVEKVNIYHPSANVVEVYVLPVGGDIPSQALKDNLAAYLDNIRMITEDVRILNPTLAPVNISIDVWIAPGFSLTDTSQKIEDVIRAELDKHEFARALYPSDIYTALRKEVAGLVKADLNIMAREDGVTADPVLCAPHEVITSGTVTVNAQRYAE